MNLENQFKYTVKTLGCKANVYDSLLIEKHVGEIGGVPDHEDPRVFILNSCTVTNGADKQCAQEVKNIKKKHPNAVTVITGCYAQVAADTLKAKTGVDLVITNDEKSNLKNIIAQRLGIEVKSEENEDQEIFWGQLPALTTKTRAFIKIQEGCNDFCTYCIIPYARGKSRSVRMAMLLTEIERLANEGIKEVVFTGVNIADYGLEYGLTLDDLIEATLTHTKIERLRLTSLDPTEVTDRMLNLMADEKRFMPHFHISLQSPVSRVLRAMKRKYKTEDVISCLNKIANLNPNIYVGMDVIAGFPSETLEEHHEAIEILKELPWTRLHVFPYSERNGTPALKIKESVPMAERKRRANELMSMSLVRHKMFVDTQIKKNIDQVLFESVQESDEGDYLIGHTPNYVRVMAPISKEFKQSLNGKSSGINLIKKVKVLASVPKPAQDWTLECEILEN